MRRLIKGFYGGLVGVEILAAMTGEDRASLEDTCEPYLIRMGLLQKTTRGRQINPKKYLSLRRKLLGEKISEQRTLF